MGSAAFEMAFKLNVGSRARPKLKTPWLTPEKIARATTPIMVSNKDQATKKNSIVNKVSEIPQNNRKQRTSESRGNYNDAQERFQL